MIEEKVNLSQGALPLSIATSLAFEALIEHPDKEKHHVVAINVMTLARNWLGAMDFKGPVPAKLIGDSVRREMAFIEAFLKQLNLEAYFYATDSTVFYTNPVFAPLMRKLTEQDIKSMEITKYVLIATNQVRRMANLPPIVGYSGRLYQPGRRLLVFSHYNLDYVESGCALLESHTGVIKENKDLHTKYARMTGKDSGPVSFARLPYCKELIVLMGTQSLFKVRSNPMRKVLLHIAEKYEWNPIMPVRSLIMGLSDPEIKDFYNGLPKIKP
jgi:hypothetical protein